MELTRQTLTCICTDAGWPRLTRWVFNVKDVARSVEHMENYHPSLQPYSDFFRPILANFAAVIARIFTVQFSQQRFPLHCGNQT